MTTLRTFECPQCGMLFLYRSAGEEDSFAAVDHQLWLETCLDDDAERDSSNGEPGHGPLSASQRCTYAREAAGIVASVCNGTAD